MTSHPIGSVERPLRVAVIGSGPAGFYTVDALVKNKQVKVDVDLFERLPAPYGLVRFGVAPDHQKIKSVIKAYERTAQSDNVRFLGNVHVCSDISTEELLTHYDQVVFTVGCETDRKLGIRGEDLRGSHAATSFVAWYNGHPDFTAYEVDLEVERAAIVGVGDVAMDISRMLVRSYEDLLQTDVADYSLDFFAKNKVREILIIARRGPAQAAFATKELMDIVELPGVEVIVDPEHVRQAQQEEGLDGLTRRKLDYLASLAAKPRALAAKTIRLWFLASPVEILGDGGRVTAMKVERNALVHGERGTQAVGTGEYETVPVGLVFRSVGYRGVPLDGVPFDERQGIIPNVDGRVLRDGQPWPNVYVAGWIKRGPSGVIGTNKSDAADTVKKMLEDIAGRAEPAAEHKSRASVDALLASRGVRVITFDDWRKIDQFEVDTGRRLGRVRQKLTSVAAMLERLKS